ncbi:PREDICTED: exosome complex component RRP43-like [Priapulus caudatus]|uniref:Ribosomal RNA-processing protein 43 n=1 Tax=Priapulus caudatus TaxID=37621 RepID=A0ABM1EVJ3_PRICU|nr:PREDICTED: exosome complex component RRP43-like [Priapulus caudatus]
MADVFKKVEPAEYYRRHLTHDARPDGRQLLAFRDVVVSVGTIGTADGSALVRLGGGGTTVVCGVKAELASPRPDTPARGYVVPNVELPALCAATLRPGPPTALAQTLSQAMADLIENSGCVDAGALCVSPGRLVWALHVDAVCLAHNGNLADACAAAVVAALRDTTLPAITIDDETGRVRVDSGRERAPVAASAFPVAASFAKFDNDILFADPTAEEEALATATVTVATLEDGSLCLLHKAGGSAMTEKELQQCVDRAQVRGAELRHLVNKVAASKEC